MAVFESDQNFMIKWFEEYSNLDSSQYSIFLNIVNTIQGDLSLFYRMNDILDEGSGEYEYKDEKLELHFYKKDNLFVLDSSFGSISLDYYTYKTIISKIIDIYSETYPLGTVVDLDKDLFDDIVDLEADEPFRVVILNRLTPISDDLFFYYTGVVYPVGNSGTNVNMVHFSPVTIKNLVHRGYSDKEDREYIEIKKKELLIDMGMHSTNIITKEEQEMLNGIQ